jgi:hypothetical protein
MSVIQRCAPARPFALVRRRWHATEKIRCPGPHRTEEPWIHTTTPTTLLFPEPTRRFPRRELPRNGVYETKPSAETRLVDILAPSQSVQ